VATDPPLETIEGNLTIGFPLNGLGYGLNHQSAEIVDPRVLATHIQGPLLRMKQTARTASSAPTPPVSP
jgi:hypothetical protein